MVNCRRCGGEVVQKPVARLALVGAMILVAACLAIMWPILWLPAVVFALTGVYLVLWASLGHGRWCRGCKRFDGV
jgi:hypothetical protein